MIYVCLRVHMYSESEGGRPRGEERGSQADRTLSAELDAGLDPTPRSWT